MRIRFALGALALALAAAAAAGGCIEPKFAACAVECDPTGQCPSGLACNSADGYCHASTDERSCTADPDGGTDRDDAASDAAPAGPCSMLDLMFIVDDSGTMDLEQNGLAAAIPQFVTALDAHRTSNGDELAYRIGITTTSRDVTYLLQGATTSELGPDGELLATCGVTAHWLERGDANLSNTLACRVDVGTGGSAVEMPGYALELAFTDRYEDGLNVGFRREGALLGVVVVTDEDDCSRRDANFSIPNPLGCPADPALLSAGEQVAFLDLMAGARSHWTMAVVAAPDTVACSSTFAMAEPAPRLRGLVAEAGENAQLHSICAAPSATVAAVLAQLTAACEQLE